MQLASPLDWPPRRAHHPYRSAGPEAALTEAARRFASTQFARVSLRGGHLRVDRPAYLATALLLSGVFLALAAAAVSRGDGGADAAPLLLLAAATVGASLFAFRRTRLLLSHPEAGARRPGLCRHIAAREIAGLIVERNATPGPFEAKLLVVRPGGATVVVAEVASWRDGVAAARLRALAVALATWAGVGVTVRETPATAARLRRADRAEGLDVGEGQGRGALRPEPPPPEPGPFWRFLEVIVGIIGFFSTLAHAPRPERPGRGPPGPRVKATAARLRRCRRAWC